MARRNDVVKALYDLDGLISIAKNEMLIHGDYATEVKDEKKKEQGAICGGRHACLVGSLYLAHGAKIDVNSWGGVVMEGVFPHQRYDYLRNRRGLKLAYDKLNEVAERYIAKHHKADLNDALEMVEEGDIVWPPAEGYGEYLFETILGGEGDGESLAHDETREVIVKLARQAQREIKKQYTDVLAE